MKNTIETQAKVEMLLKELEPQVDTTTFNRVRDSLVQMVIVSVLPPSCGDSVKEKAPEKTRESFGEFSFDKERFIAP